MGCRWILVLGAVLGIAGSAFADGESLDSQGVAAAPPPETEKLVSEAQFDKRLPPVFPGEEISDGKRKLRVWSTSGAIPVAPVPAPPDPTGLQPHDTGTTLNGIIVDRRHTDSPAP